MGTLGLSSWAICDKLDALPSGEKATIFVIIAISTISSFEEIFAKFEVKTVSNGPMIYANPDAMQMDMKMISLAQILVEKTQNSTKFHQKCIKFDQISSKMLQI